MRIESIPSGVIKVCGEEADDNQFFVLFVCLFVCFVGLYLSGVTFTSLSPLG